MLIDSEPTSVEHVEATTRPSTLYVTILSALLLLLLMFIVFLVVAYVFEMQLRM